MDTAYEPSKQDFLLQEEDGLVSVFRGRFVDKDHQEPGADQHQKQHQGHAAEAKSMCIPECPRRDANGPHMQYQGIGEDPPGHNCTIRVKGKAGIVAVLLRSTRLLSCLGTCE